MSARFGYKGVKPEAMVAVAEDAVTRHNRKDSMGFKFTTLGRHRDMEFYVKPRAKIGWADALDRIELLVTEQTFLSAAPLVDRLRRRTLGRRGYNRLVALFVANCIATGQIDETDKVLVVIEGFWSRCPAKYLQWWA